MPDLVRDRLTWLVYLQLGIYGYILYGIGPSVQLLRDEQNVSRTISGLHGTALAAAALSAGALGPGIVTRIGRGAALWSGITTSCGGVVLFCATDRIALTLVGVFLAGFGGSLVVNSSATVLLAHHGARGPGAVSEAHATAAVVGALAPLVIGIAVAIGAGWRAGLLLSVPFLATLALVLGRERAPDHRETVTRAEPSRLPATYWWAWGVIGLCVAVEFSMAIWTSDVLHDRVGLSDGAAAAGVTAVVGGMAVGRLFGARLALRFDSDWLMYRAIALAGAGFGLFWLSSATAPALAGLVVCGLGLALHFPLGVMRAIRTASAQPDLAAARASIAVGLAVGTGPFLLGALADGLGTHTAFLVVPVFLTGAALCVRRSAAASA